MADMSLEEVRALLARVKKLEDETAIDDTTELQGDPEWLRIPAARRAVALARLGVLREYDGRDLPTKADAVAAASKVGVQLRTFYAMLRGWREKGRSPFALVPYRPEDGDGRPSRLGNDVSDELGRRVGALLADTPSIAPGEAVRIMEREWPAALRRPSAVTMRAYLEKARAARPAKPGSIRLPGSSGSQKADRFGEVLVVDHASPARLLLDGKTAASPTVTLVIDLWSATPVGAAVYEGEPGPDGVLDALADARARMEEHGAGVPVTPLVVFDSTAGREWAHLGEDLARAGLTVAESRDHRLQHGRAISRLLGNALGTIGLQSLRARRRGVSRLDAEQDSLLTMNQLRFVIDVAVQDNLKKRLSALPGGSAGRLELSGPLSTRSSLKEMTGPLISLRGDEGGSSPARAGTCEAKDQARPGQQTAAAAADDRFAGELVAIVGEILGGDLHDVEVDPPSSPSPGWRVAVTVRDRSIVAEAWLRLARTAVKYADRGDGLIRFEVKAATTWR